MEPGPPGSRLKCPFHCSLYKLLVDKFTIDTEFIHHTGSLRDFYSGFILYILLALLVHLNVDRAPGHLQLMFFHYIVYGFGSSCFTQGYISAIGVFANLIHKIIKVLRGHSDPVLSTLHSSTIHNNCTSLLLLVLSLCATLGVALLRVSYVSPIVNLGVRFGSNLIELFYPTATMLVVYNTIVYKYVNLLLLGMDKLSLINYRAIMALPFQPRESGGPLSPRWACNKFMNYIRNVSVLPLILLLTIISQKGIEARPISEISTGTPVLGQPPISSHHPFIRAFVRCSCNLTFCFLIELTTIFLILYSQPMSIYTPFEPP